MNTRPPTPHLQFFVLRETIPNARATTQPNIGGNQIIYVESNIFMNFMKKYHIKKPLPTPPTMISMIPSIIIQTFFIY